MQAAALLLLLVQTVVPAPAVPQPPAGPLVALDVVQGQRTLGTIEVALDLAKAPISVENFLRYVREGHYDGTTFHRVMPGFMIQGGGFTPTMVQKPTRAPIQNEAKNGLRNSRGTVAMARTQDPNSATAQFFINVRDNHRLDYGIEGAGYAVFGRVVEGMDVVDKIVALPTTSRGPYDNVPELSVVIKRARELKAPAPAATKSEAPAAKP
jgi:peptidyl-prolyl cis-trans isomerase A (cyclophilin A)